MKRLISVLTILIICVSFAAMETAGAELVSYDKFTGDRIYSDESLNDQVNISDSCVYRRDIASYVFTTGSMDGSSVISNVYDGMMTNDAVRLDIGERSRAQVYRNGEIMAPEETAEIRTPGNYRVLEGDKLILSFKIIDSRTNDITSYPMPAGFSVTDFEMDSNPVSGYDRNYIDMLEEGFYLITYKCNKTDISYTLKTTIDRTPPEVTFEGVTDGLAKGPVTVSCEEEGVTFSCIRNGNEVTFMNPVKESGDYIILARDAAGNTLEERFTVNIYFNISAWAALALVIIFIFGIIGYLIFIRGHLRVR